MMNNYNLMDTEGLIVNKDNVIKSVKYLNKKYTNMKDVSIAFKINEEHNKTPRFFNKYYEELEDELGSKYKWIYTGLTTAWNEPIIFQYIKLNNEWRGAFVNTEAGILKHSSEKDGVEHKITPLSKIPYANTKISIKEETDTVKEDIENKYISKRICTDISETCEFYNELYNKMLIKSDWDITANDNLRTYIETLIERLNHKLKNNKPVDEFLIFNEQRDAVVFNTGLLDTFGKSILVVDSMHGSEEMSFTKLNVLTSKVALIRQGFTKEGLNKDITRVFFYEKDSSELIFNGSIEDFDLENWARLVHCINERRNRYPESFADSTDEVICQDLIKAIEVGVKINKYDSNYIKPCYFRRNDSLSFIIPYHVGNNFQKDAELGIVISKYNGTDYWQVFTILDARAAHINIKTLGLYTTETFR